MRYEAAHKAETRTRILTAAARVIRANGADAMSVAEVMASAGLTHGGFYAHFASKTALVEDAVDTMFDDARGSAARLDDALTGDAAALRVAFADYLSAYLSARHRDRPDRGCPLPALSTDMARSSGAAAVRFAQGVETIAARIANVLERLDVPEPRAEAVAVVAQMAGAVSLARAVGPGAQSDEILRATLATLSARFGL